MLVFDKIIQQAIQQNKNILVIGSPRSGTHALGDELSRRITGSNYLGEICMVSDQPNSHQQIQALYDTDRITVAQVVQLIPKIQLAKNIDEIRSHAVIVNIRRKDKVKQFASWIYFRVADPTALHGWHNHTQEKTRVTQNSIAVQPQDMEQFMLEQMIDDYFLPDFRLCYEDLTFTRTSYQKNTFAFPLEQIFSNLDYVTQCLGDWNYSPDHFDHE